jgi:hypothetical protein
MCYYSVYLIEEKRQLYSDVDSIASRGGRREKVKIERKEKGGGGETPNSIQLGCVCVRHIYIYMSKSAFGSLEKLWSVVDVVTPLTSAKRRSRLYSLSLSLLIPPHHHQFFFLTLFFFYTECCSRFFTCVSLSKLAGSWYIYNNWKVCFLI